MTSRFEQAEPGKRTVSWGGVRTAVTKGKVGITRLKHGPRLPGIIKERDWKPPTIKQGCDRIGPNKQHQRQPSINDLILESLIFRVAADTQHPGSQHKTSKKESKNGYTWVQSTRTSNCNFDLKQREKRRDVGCHVFRYLTALRYKDKWVNLNTRCGKVWNLDNVKFQHSLMEPIERWTF